MEVFRVTQAKYAISLYASGWEGRWNQEGQKVIYTASSRSLACLENLVHRRGRGLLADFRVMVIYLPDDLAHERIELGEQSGSSLAEGWNKDADVSYCQQLGAAWYRAGRTPVLSVPSAVIPMERNLVINTEQSEYSRIRLIHTEPFGFDPRLIGSAES